MSPGRASVGANIQSAIAKLKHKDVRQRRRAVRILFDSDAYESVEAFSPLLDDKDIWFRNKAIEAYRRWAPKHAPHLLVEQQHRRCCSVIGEQVSQLLLNHGSNRALMQRNVGHRVGHCLTVRRAVHQLISSAEVTKAELDAFQQAEDHVVRAYATEVNSNTSNLLVSLQDDHPDVRRQAAASLLGMELTEKENAALQNAINQDDALWKLAVPIALQNRLPNLLDLMKSKSNSQRKFLVQSLKDAVGEADDERLRTLIDGDCTSIVARWLVGRNDAKSDALRTELLFDERVDSIDKSRLLERLLHRQQEPAMQELAERLISESDDELVLSAAQNLYTS